MADDTEQAVWIRTTPAAHHTYRPALEIDDDTAHDLGGGIARAHASAVIEAAARAEYDAAIYRQMNGDGPQDKDMTAHLIRGIRAERPPIEWPTPLTLEPGVSVSTGDPFLHLHVRGKVIGQWTIADAQRHAVGALEAESTATLDGDYLRTLLACGVPEGRARMMVAGLGDVAGRA